MANKIYIPNFFANGGRCEVQQLNEDFPRCITLEELEQLNGQIVQSIRFILDNRVYLLESPTSDYLIAKEDV